ncbi:MAG: DUF2207 domain-containing protein, partial [bacterium]
MKKTLIFALVIVTQILATSSSAESKSYRIERVAILAQVNPDGSMDIRESRTYRFRGQFKWADYRLPIKGFSSVENFTLRDGDMAYRPSDSEERGTYEMQISEEEFYVKWFYRASNENRTFVLSYRVTDVLNVYPDVAEIYYQFIGADWDHGAREVTVTV